MIEKLKTSLYHMRDGREMTRRTLELLEAQYAIKAFHDIAPDGILVRQVSAGLHQWWIIRVYDSTHIQVALINHIEPSIIIPYVTVTVATMAYRIATAIMHASLDTSHMLMSDDTRTLYYEPKEAK